MKRRDSQDSKTSCERSDSRASVSTDSSKMTEKTDIETQTIEEERVGNTFETEWEEQVRKSVFQPGYLPQPYPVGALPFNWHEHSKLLLGRKNQKTSRDKVKCWNISQVVDFITDIPNIDHESISSKLSLEEIEISDNRYNHVVHLQSAAIGAEKFYTIEDHSARFEGIELARDRDRKAMEAWRDHPYVDIIDNRSDFDSKINRLIDLVVKRIGIDVGDRWALNKIFMKTIIIRKSFLT